MKKIEKGDLAAIDTLLEDEHNSLWDYELTDVVRLLIKKNNELIDEIEALKKQLH